MQLDVNSRIAAIKSVLVNENLKIINPTSIQLPLSFEEGKTSFIQQSDLNNTQELISTFVSDFVKPRSDRILFWQESNTIKLGTVVIVDNVPELHYISIVVG
jgi:hypothetical protein